jgi:hypothetical protein
LNFFVLLDNYFNDLILIICEYLMDGSFPATQYATPLHGCSVYFFADLGRP